MKRRAFLAALAGALAAGCTATGPTRSLTIAAGEPQGFYLAFGRLLAAQINSAEPWLQCTAVETTASLANIDLLRTGKADLALVLADAARAADSAQPPFTTSVDLRALGRVYENYLQLVVLNDSPYTKLSDLDGHSISLGATGSGASLTGDRIIAAAGISPRVQHLPLADAVSALSARAIDALLWSGGVPTPALATLDSAVGIRLLPLDGVLPALRSRHGLLYEQLPVPSGGYRYVHQVPTIGVANLLVSLPTLPDNVAAAIVDVLIDRAGQLVPQEAIGTQFLDIQTLIGTADLPLHPGAAAAYRRHHG
ncbi:TAXI family TRAP transporter solute-binding subunit [Kutzneria chonburiensis]|uniref:TAXI family TRAP transporter solute-binding subunit n=1 Tax=Kutzneria chonburiensis TaxID=1483604 RepID=A0ABV6N0J5_9PSEU|nr:TAXI family TRAP transporter solute-binding subunit [Kutzneria chonburiensis]